jgi:hypothetical protein
MSKVKTLDEIIDECSKREEPIILPREEGAWLLNDKGNYSWVPGATQATPMVTNREVEDAWGLIQTLMPDIKKSNTGGA